MGLKTGPPPRPPGRRIRAAGSGSLDSEGYAALRVGGVWHRVHRLVMELRLGRPLGPEECVHHRDGNKTHNCPPNLELTTNDAHSWHHHHTLPLVGYCLQCGEPFLQKRSHRKPRRFC